MPLRLIIEDEEGSTTVVPLASDAITIGRQPGNTIQLTERNVSRRHARLSPEGEQWTIEDLESYNGVKVNGAPISGRVTLKEGDVVQIGDYHLAITEDPEKQSLNYETRADEAANEEPLLASSSVLPRLSKEELEALLPGESAGDDDGLPPAPAPPLTAASSGEVTSSEAAGEGLVVPAETTGEHRDEDDEDARRPGMGLFVGGGIVLGLLVAGVLAWQASEPQERSEPHAVTPANPPTAPAEPTPLAPPAAQEREEEPSPAAAEVAARTDVGAGEDEAMAAEAEADDDPAASEAGSPEKSTTSPKRGEDARRSGARSTARTSDAESGAKTERRAKSKSDATAKSEPAKPSEAASEPADDDAAQPAGNPEELLTQARMEQFKNPAQAYELAQSAYAIKRSQGALVVMANAACRLGDATKAKKAIAKLQGDAKEKMASACRKQGVNF